MQAYVPHTAAAAISPRSLLPEEPPPGSLVAGTVRTPPDDVGDTGPVLGEEWERPPAPGICLGSRLAVQLCQPVDDRVELAEVHGVLGCVGPAGRVPVIGGCQRLAEHTG